MLTSLVLLIKDRGLAYLEMSVEFDYGKKRTILLILNIDRGLAYLGVSGDFEHGLYADQPAYPEQNRGLVYIGECLLILRMGIMRTCLVILNIDKVWPTLKCLLILRMGIMRTSLVILNIERDLAYLGVSGEIENG